MFLDKIEKCVKRYEEVAQVLIMQMNFQNSSLALTQKRSIELQLTYLLKILNQILPQGMPSCYGKLEENKETMEIAPRYLDFQLLSRVNYLMKIVNKVQTAQNIDVKVHFELEIQLQEYIKNFKSNVLGDQKVMEFCERLVD